MMEYVAMVATQITQVLLMNVSKSAMAGGMSNYSFIFYSNVVASITLLPLSLIFHRSASRPPLSLIVICGFLIIGILGFLAQIFAYSGISYSSATLASTLLNLTPGFTFILAILCRMEAVDFKRSSTNAKFIGTAVTIAGAIIMTLYQGPQILSSSLKSNDLLVQPSNWVLGGIFLAINCVFASMYLISQAFVLKKYPAVMIVMFAYCSICAILSALTSLIVEDDMSSYSLKPKKRLLSVIYSDINFWGNVYPTYVALPYLRKSNGRIVVNAAVENWLPLPRMSIYSAAKAALVNFYETLRLELDGEVGITIATHGWIGAEMTRGKFMLEEGAEMQWKEERDTMFHPIGIVIATLIGVVFLGDGFYLGSLLGSVIVVIGFYTVVWGKSEEEKIVAFAKLGDERGPLLQEVVEPMPN